MKTFIIWVALEKQQRKQLEGMLVRGRWSQREISRAKILLEADSQDKLNQAEISRKVGCGIDKVRRVLRRYLGKKNLEDALRDLPRSGQPEKLAKEEQAFVIATSCSAPPNGAEYWTLTLLQNQVKKRYKKQVCLNCIRRVQQKNDLKPWKKKDVVCAHIG